MLVDLQKNLLQKIKRHQSGISLQELFTYFEEKVAKRTLQNWLKTLVESETLVVDGKGKATRYKIKRKESELNKSPQKLESEILLSQKSKELVDLVHRPIQKRKPVGYNSDFLHNYKPNVTQYLPKSLLSKLKKQGTSNITEKAAGTYATQILERLLIDFSWNSSRLEGNTYSLLDTQRLIQFGETADGKANFESQMILNHKEAIEFLVHNSENIGYNNYTILNVHALLSNNLLSNPASCGKLRKIPVAIGQTVFEPLYIPQLVEEYFEKILTKARLIKDPFEQSFFILVQIPYLQPFEDVNKRVSRLSSNIPFIKKNLCPFSFIDVPEKDYIDGIIAVYEHNRVELLRDIFEWGYERSCQRYLAVRQSLGEPDLFRMKYRTQMIQCINEVINKIVNKKESIRYLKSWSTEHIDKKDKLHFDNVIIEELESLHEGNIARFRIQLDKFYAWNKKFK